MLFFWPEENDIRLKVREKKWVEKKFCFHVRYEIEEFFF